MIEPIAVRVYRFKPEDLDPITVYVEQYSETASRIIVRCWDKAWTAYWGSHGSNPVEQFFMSANTGYLLGYLLYGWKWSLLKSHVKPESVYLERVINAIKAEFSKGIKA